MRCYSPGRMLRSSKALPLVLIGTVTAMAGYEAIAPHELDWDDGYATTQPTGYHSSGSYGYHHYGGYSHGYYGSSSHSGTSRGGFGSSGHAAGS